MKNRRDSHHRIKLFGINCWSKHLKIKKRQNQNKTIKIRKQRCLNLRSIMIRYKKRNSKKYWKRIALWSETRAKGVRSSSRLPIEEKRRDYSKTWIHRAKCKTLQKLSRIWKLCSLWTTTIWNHWPRSLKIP